MQEALVHYAGDDPRQGGQFFLDTLGAMGMRMFELVPGNGNNLPNPLHLSVSIRAYD